MDNPADWNIAEDRSWIDTIVQVIDHFTLALNVEKGMLARAVGFGSNLSPATLQASPVASMSRRVRSCFTPRNMPVVAARLHIPSARYPLVEQLFSEILEALDGISVDMTASRGTKRLSIDFAFAGSTLFDQGNWDIALPYLESAWQYLSQDKAALASPDSLFAALRVGAQLISFDNQNGFSNQTFRRLTFLRSLARTALNMTAPDHRLIAASTQLITAAGVAYRLEGSMKARDAASFAKQSVRILESSGLDTFGLIAAWRDQAKPLIRAALTTSSLVEARADFDEGMNALVQSERLSGGTNGPFEAFQEAWLLTRLTRIECLACSGNADEARGLLEQTEAMPWMGKILKARSLTHLPAKLKMSRMAVLASLGRCDELSLACVDYDTTSAFSKLKDRARRNADLKRFAETPDPILLYQAILR